MYSTTIRKGLPLVLKLMVHYVELYYWWTDIVLYSAKMIKWTIRWKLKWNFLTPSNIFKHSLSNLGMVLFYGTHNLLKKIQYTIKRISQIIIICKRSFIILLCLKISEIFITISNLKIINKLKVLKHSHTLTKGKIGI